MIQRSTYAVAEGRDRYIVRVLRDWLSATIPSVIQRAGERPRVLDVGCGEQPWRPLIEKSGAAYTGFDASQNTRTSVRVVGVIERALPEPWPDSSSQYDVILCTEVLEFVTRWDRAFENIAALLKPGGRLIVTVPFMFPLHEEPFDHFRGTLHSLRIFAAQHGLIVEQEERLGDAWDVMATVLTDMSILPSRRTLWPRLKSRLVQRVVHAAVALAQAPLARAHLRVNSNTYLSSAVVLHKPTLR